VASIATACSSSPLTTKKGSAGHGGSGVAGATGGASGAGSTDGAAGATTGVGGASGATADASGAAGMVHVVVDAGQDAGSDAQADAAIDAGADGVDESSDATPDDGAAPCLLTLNAVDASVPAACVQQTPTTSFCGITMDTIVPATLCPGAASCPATLLAQLSCDGGLANPPMWLVPRADGASILFDVGSSQSADLADGQLFTIVSGGTSRVENFPLIINGTLTRDGAGITNYFAGSPTGGWRFRQRADGWAREDIPADPAAEFPEVQAARAVDDQHAFAVVNAGGNLQIAARDPTGWHTTPVPGTLVTEFGVAMELDAAGHPWLATVGSHDPGDTDYLDLVSAAGTLDTVGAVDLTGFFPAALALLPGGLVGTDARPSIAFPQADGIHFARATGASGWVQTLVPGSTAKAVVTTECPEPLVKATGAICQRGSCDAHSTGSAGGFGVARTTEGNTYAAWLAIDATDTYQLLPDQGPCGSSCTCEIGNLLSRSGSSDLVIAGLPVDGVSVPPATRFHFADATDGVGTIAMAARGNTLLVAVYVGLDSKIDVRYLEIDARMLP
jgi:hypothetical protein